MKPQNVGDPSPELGSAAEESVHQPTFGEALRFWVKLGFISFGGPAGQIAILHTELVEKRKWISEERFLHALNFCMLLPGPEAQQLTTYLGWLFHGVRGGIVAGALFILPSVALLWGLSWLYAAGGTVPWVAALFWGLQPAVLAIVIGAVLRISKKSLRSPRLAALALAAFVAIYFFKISFVWILLGAALVGLGFVRPTAPESTAVSALANVQRRVSGWVLAGGLALWWLPILGAGLIGGWAGLYFQQGLFFSQTALITFGGAYAVLPYVAQHAVEQFGWLHPNQMIAGLALAETTPGPLIMVLQFVGFLAAWQHPGSLPPWLAGTLGAAITTWATFLPSFLLVFAGAPYMERLRSVPKLTAALSGITAAVVGVILNLAVWFGWHILLPNGRMDPLALAASLLFFLGLQFGKWTPLPVILAGGLLGVASQWLGKFFL